MSLNQTQLKYARERLEAINTKKARELQEKHTVPAIKYTVEEKLAKLKSGDWKERSDFKNSWSIEDHIDFGERLSHLDANFQAASTSLKNEYTKILDELVLGDSEQALEAIKKFGELSIKTNKLLIF